MLDANLIKFVEPIGPGQIVDRESLVALPTGQLKLTIETSQEHVIVRVLAMRGADDFNIHVGQTSSWNFHAYIWQNGQVIAAEKLVDWDTKERTGTIGRRRSPGARNFKFTKEAKEHVEDNSVIDAILQICVYQSQSGAMQRSKEFLGTVHIALNYLTSNEFQCPESGVACKEEWFKVFPKSTFLPGCPSSIAKTNCAVSGHSQPEMEQPEEVPELPICRKFVRSQSTVSIKQYDLKFRQRSKSNSSSVILEQDESPEKVKTPSIGGKMKSRVTNWMKTKLTRRATVPVFDSTHRRTPDSAKCEDSSDMAPVIVGPRRRSRTCPAFDAASSPTNALLPLAENKPEMLHSTGEIRSATDNIKKNLYKASRSNNSSFDVGYESGRSRCLSSSDDENSLKSTESNINNGVCGNNSAAEENCQDHPPKRDHAVEDQPTSSTGSRQVFQKRRPAMLQRMKTISNTTSFTSLNEIRRKSLEKTSSDPSTIKNS